MHKRIEEIVNAVREKFGIRGRSFTKRDFYRICDGEGIRLLNRDTYAPTEGIPLYELRGIRGMHFTLRNNGVLRPFIYLRCFWLKRFDLHTAFHELGHHFCGSTIDAEQSFTLAFARDHEAYKDHPDERAADRFAELCIRSKSKKEVPAGQRKWLARTDAILQRQPVTKPQRK